MEAENNRLFIKPLKLNSGGSQQHIMRGFTSTIAIPATIPIVSDRSDTSTERLAIMVACLPYREGFRAASSRAELLSNSVYGRSGGSPV